MGVQWGCRGSAGSTMRECLRGGDIAVAAVVNLIRVRVRREDREVRVRVGLGLGLV